MTIDTSFLDGIQRRIDELPLTFETEEAGIVAESADGIARIRGMASVTMGEMIEFPGKIFRHGVQPRKG